MCFVVAFLTHSFYPVGLFVAHQIHQAWYRLASESFQWCSLSLECFYLRYSCSFTWLLACFFRSLWKYALLGETFPDHFFKMSWIPSYPLCVILFKNLSPLMNSHICAEKCTCHTCTVDVFWQSEHIYWTAPPDREIEHPRCRSTHPLAHALLLSSITMKCSAGFWILYKQNYTAYIHLRLASLISYFHYSVGSIIWVYSCVVLCCFVFSSTELL